MLSAQWLATLAASAIAAAIALGTAAWFVVQRRLGARRRNRDVCPNCLAEGSLQIVPDPSSRRFDTVVCHNVISNDPHEECGFEFPAHYLDYPKLAFTTLGAPFSGKTMWVAMLHALVRRAAIRSDVELTPLPGRGSERFARMAEVVINLREAPEATQLDRLDPLILEFCDRRKRRGLVNLYDFAGEVTIRGDLRSTLRRRQLQAEGYLFFLDPSQDAELQVRALNDFYISCRQARGLHAGATIDSPLAICLSKLDLLPTQPYYEPGGTVDRFFDGLREIDPTGRALSNRIIDDRSNLSVDLLTLIWPGWDILRQAQSFFGNRCRIFPLTSVGLNDLTVTCAHDARHRTLEPFALAEPFLWLLHQNRYAVFR